MSEENHRIWDFGVGGWGARKDRRLNYREKIWRNCYEKTIFSVVSAVCDVWSGYFVNSLFCEFFLLFATVSSE